MTTLIKLGGSLITDKRAARAFRADATSMIARQIAEIWRADPGLRLVIGHGSGSFGHYEAAKHQTASGVDSAEQWRGFVQVAEAAASLSQLVLLELLRQGLPALRFQASSMITASAGQIAQMPTSLIAQALQVNLIPLVHGDVALDSRRGGAIISTERIFVHLVHHLVHHLVPPLSVSRIILLGEVDGVMDADGRVIPTISPDSFASVKSALGRSAGIDVTGGMLQKVAEMLALVRQYPDLEVIIANGRQPDILTGLLRQNLPTGTRICHNSGASKQR